jgi:hypothetical protein
MSDLTNQWSLLNLELVLGPAVDHGGPIVRESYPAGSHRLHQPGPFTFFCGCLAVGLAPNLRLRACSISHAALTSAA